VPSGRNDDQVESPVQTHLAELLIVSPSHSTRSYLYSSTENASHLLFQWDSVRAFRSMNAEDCALKSCGLLTTLSAVRVRPGEPLLNNLHGLSEITLKARRRRCPYASIRIRDMYLYGVDAAPTPLFA